MSNHRLNKARRHDLRERASEAQNHRCAYCGTDIRLCATLEHVIPISQGGGKGWENLVAACRSCNERRGSLDAVAFFNYMCDIREMNTAMRDALMRELGVANV